MESLLPELACLLVDEMGTVQEVERLAHVNRWFWRMRRRLLLHFMQKMHYRCDQPACSALLVPVRDASGGPVIIFSDRDWLVVSGRIYLGSIYTFCCANCVNIFNESPERRLWERGLFFNLVERCVDYKTLVAGYIFFQSMSMRWLCAGRVIEKQ